MNTTNRVFLAFTGLMVGLAPALVAWAVEGDLDTSFSDDGMVTWELGVRSAANGVAIDDDGSVVVAGSATDDGEVGMLGRLDGNGGFDGSFLGGGFAMLESAGAFPFGGVELDAAGRIVVAGRTESGAVGVARFHDDGSVDTGFGMGGVSVIPELVAHIAPFTRLAIDGQGRIVVSTSVVPDGAGETIGVARLLDDGSLDPSFDSDGVASFDLDPSTGLDQINRVGDITVDAMDRPVLVGSASSALFIARLTLSGALDSSFGTDGVFHSTPDEEAMRWGWGVMVSPDSTIYAVGQEWSDPVAENKPTVDSAGIVVAVDSDGVSIPGFGDDGTFRFGAGDDDLYLFAGALDASGGILGAGVRANTNPPTSDLVLVRVLPDGSVDTSFGDDGYAQGPPGSEDPVGWDVAVTPTGAIVVVGERNGHVLVVRYSGPEAPPSSTTSTTAASSSTSSTSVGGSPSTTVPSSSTTTVVPAVPPVLDPFSDDDGSVFEGDIEWLAKNGITSGCNPPANTEFCPDDVVTRGQMAAFLVRALGLTATGSRDFSDDDGSVFEADIQKLAEAGITLGCNPPANTRFCPGDPVTRGQMAAFLVRALGLTATGSHQFSDDDGSVFESDIERLAAAGITVGCNPPANTSFCPDDRVTRGQMAAFLHRAFTED